MKYLIKLTITSNNLNDICKSVSKLYIVMILQSWDPDVPELYMLSILVVVWKNTHHTLLLMSCTKQIPVQLIFNLFKFWKISSDLSEIAVVRKSWELCVVSTDRKVFHRPTYGPEIVGSWCAVCIQVFAGKWFATQCSCVAVALYTDTLVYEYGFNGDNCHFLLMLLLVESPWYASHR